jgi:hypothetical protein
MQTFLLQRCQHLKLNLAKQIFGGVHYTGIDHINIKLGSALHLYFIFALQNPSVFQQSVCKATKA